MFVWAAVWAFVFKTIALIWALLIEFSKWLPTVTRRVHKGTQKAHAHKFNKFIYLSLTCGRYKYNRAGFVVSVIGKFFKKKKKLTKKMLENTGQQLHVACKVLGKCMAIIKRELMASRMRWNLKPPHQNRPDQPNMYVNNLIYLVINMWILKL